MLARGDFWHLANWAPPRTPWQFLSLHQHHCLEMPTCHLAASPPLTSLVHAHWFGGQPLYQCLESGPMRTTVPPALSPPATPHFRLPLNSSMSLEMANIQQFSTQKNSNFMKLNLTELSMIPPPITIRHSMSVHLIDANICPLLQWQPTPVLLPGQSQGRGSVMDCHLWGCTESDTTEWLHLTYWDISLAGN